MRLIEKVWFHQHPAKWLLVPLLMPLTLLFWLLSSIRRACFHLQIKKSYAVDKPVIVVGNIGVGGNGKTPMVIYLIQLCQSLGLKPGVISRGYGGTAPVLPYLLTGSSTTTEAGDEPILIFQRCQVPVVVGGNRVDSAKLVIEQGCDIVISDDGLQHYRLKRDLELIIVDGKRLFGNGLLLPSGPLREGKWRLSTSDLVVYNGGVEKKQKPYNKKSGSQLTHSINMELAADKLCNMKTGEEISIAEFIKHSSKVNAIAGIGSPKRFFDTLTANNFNLEHSLGFIDHHKFMPDDFSQFNGNIPLLMTEKDAVKCTEFAKENWWYLPVSASFTQLAANTIEEKIFKLVNR